MRQPNNALSAEMVGIAGATGSGKTTWLKRQLKRRKRVLIFDVKNEYGDIAHESFDSIAALAAKCRRVKSGRFAFVPSDKTDLEKFAAVVWAWANCTAVVEESSAFTHPGKASANYHRCITQGRGYGVRMFVVTQRPAESDKTIWGNASMIWCGRLSRQADRKSMAAEMDQPVSALNKLGKLQFLTLDMDTQKITPGRVTF